MDTLCVPVHEDLKSYRDKAISLMGQTYRDASAVLILDREIQRLDISTVSPLEQDILTAFIGWTRRLWTLQEAALASRLYIQTLLTPYKLESTTPSLSLRDELYARVCFREDMAAFTRSRIPPMSSLTRTIVESSEPQPGVFPITTNSTPFQRLALAVQHRTTSKMDDEPVILAIMLGLDFVESFRAAGPDRDARMAALFVLLRDIPSDIIFFGGVWQCCAQAPFRWAPRSLLGFPRLALRPSFGPVAVCDARGLHVRYEGFVVDDGEEGTQPRVSVGSSERRRYAVDTMSGTKYEFHVREDAGSMVMTIPKRVVLLYGGQETVLASITREVQGDGEDHDENHEIEVVVVGHWVMVASGVMLEFADEVPVLKGVLKTSDQRWCIT